MEPFVGTIFSVLFQYAPYGYMMCEGQTLLIENYRALYGLIGTTYGGDGATTFCLPDLRSRTVVGVSPQDIPDQSVPQVMIGQTGGSSSVTVVGAGPVEVTLSADALPPHAHTVTITDQNLNADSTLYVTSQNDGQQIPEFGATLCSTANSKNAAQASIYMPPPVPPDSLMVPLSQDSVTTVLSGSASITTNSAGYGEPVIGQFNTSSPSPVSIMQPYLGVNFMIAVFGDYPMQQ